MELQNIKMNIAAIINILLARLIQHTRETIQLIPAFSHGTKKSLDEKPPLTRQTPREISFSFFTFLRVSCKLFVLKRIRKHL